MKKILAATGEKIKRIIETAIGACLNQLIKLKEWLKRVRNGILNKLLVKISSLSLEEYSPQLIEERMKELRDSLPSEEGKEAKTLFDFISRSPKEDLEKIAILAETARPMQEKDAREIFEFISKSPKEYLEKIADLARNIRSIQEKDAKSVFEFFSNSSKEDLAKILTLAEVTKEFEARDAKSISTFIKKFSKDELEKTAILAETERAIQEKDAREILDFFSKSSKEDLAKILTLAEATKEFKVRDAESISEFIKKFSTDELEKTAILAETAGAVQEKDARAISDFISKSPKEDVEKITTLAETTRAIQEKNWGAIFDDESRLKLIEQLIQKVEELEKEGIKPADISKKELIRLKELKETLKEYKFDHGDESRLKVIKRLILEMEELMEAGVHPAEITEDALKKTGLTARIAEILSRSEMTDLPEGYNNKDEIPLIDLLNGIIDEIEKLKLTTSHSRGVGLLKRGAFKEAYECFKTMTDIRQGLKGAWLNRGVALGCLGETDKEIMCYNEALQIDKNYEKAKENKRIAESRP